MDCDHGYFCKETMSHVQLDGHFVVPTHNKIVVTVTSILLPGPQEDTVNCPLAIETESLTHAFQYTHPHIHTSIHPFIHPYIHPYIHTYIHTFIHTSIYSYIHTSIHPPLEKWTSTFSHSFTYIRTIHIHTYIAALYRSTAVTTLQLLLIAAIC